MTKREREAEIWQEYYRAISSYEYWGGIRGSVSSLLYELKQNRDALTQYESEGYNRVLKVAQGLSDIVKEVSSKYCSERPSKPTSSRPYGDL